MEKVVYILGAGFSAPLGLPLMHNFIKKSKDMFFENQTNYAHFNEIYDLIKAISYLKNYLNSDLTNIEEILSIMEMNYYIDDKDDLVDKYKKYLKDVIAYYTPAIELDEVVFNTGNWEDFIFNRNYQSYGHFISAMFNIEFKRVNLTDGRKIVDFSIVPKSNNYSIITLNYDLVIESIVNFINENFGTKQSISINNDSDVNTLYISKLHGSLNADIIPPTWNKRHPHYLREYWKRAHVLIRDANYIRILGYSLPLSDNYVKYLFANALKDSKHLKNIDVICKDSDGSTEKRYKDLFIFPKLKYSNSDITTYIGGNKFIRENHREKTFLFSSDILESWHKEFMRG
jgi:hypothetical protein